MAIVFDRKCDISESGGRPAVKQCVSFFIQHLCKSRGRYMSQLLHMIIEKCNPKVRCSCLATKFCTDLIVEVWVEDWAMNVTFWYHGQISLGRFPTSFGRAANICCFCTAKGLNKQIFVNFVLGSREGFVGFNKCVEVQQFDFFFCIGLEVIWCSNGLNISIYF